MTPEINIQFVESHLTVQGKSGAEYEVLCPIHGEKNASMRVNVDKGVFFCHGCHAKGGMFALAKHLGVSYRYNKSEAGMARLRSKLELLRKRDEPEEVHYLPESALKRFSIGNTPYWTDPMPKGRGLNEETVEAFDLGYDPLDESAIIPVRDMWGNLLGVTRRSLRRNAQIKYRDPKHFKKRDNLFGSWFVAEAEQPTVVLTEGPLDCIKVWQAGHPAVGVYGSYVSERQIMTLRRLGIVTCILMFDNDKAGKQAFKQCKGFTQDNTGKWTYNPATDLRKFFILRGTSYKGLSANDPGGLTDEEIDHSVTSAKLLLR